MLRCTSIVGGARSAKPRTAGGPENDGPNLYPDRAAEGARDGRVAPGVQVSDFRTDGRSAVAPFEQLRTALRDRISDGSLPAGHRLPTVRAYAAELGLATNTVARAYRELEEQGFIETRGRLGTYVAAQGDPASTQGQLAARAYVDRVRELGVEPADAIAWVTAMLDEQERRAPGQ